MCQFPKFEHLYIHVLSNCHAFLCKILILMSYLGVNKENYLFYFGKEAKKGQIPKFTYLEGLEGIQNFYFTSNFDPIFFSWLYWDFSAVSTDFLHLPFCKIKSTESDQKVSNSKILYSILVSSNFNVFFSLQHVHLYELIKKMSGKWDKRDPIKKFHIFGRYT